MDKLLWSLQLLCGLMFKRALHCKSMSEHLVRLPWGLPTGGIISTVCICTIDASTAGSGSCVQQC